MTHPSLPPVARSDTRRATAPSYGTRYANGDDAPRWPELIAGLRSRGVSADESALATLPLVLEFDDEVAALYGI